MNNSRVLLYSKGGIIMWSKHLTSEGVVAVSAKQTHTNCAVLKVGLHTFNAHLQFAIVTRVWDLTSIPRFVVLEKD